MIEKFELSLIPYIQARSKFETTMTNLKGIVNTLFITHAEGDVMTERFKEKIQEMMDTGLAQAVKTGNAFNWQQYHPQRTPSYVYRPKRSGRYL